MTDDKTKPDGPLQEGWLDRTKWNPTPEQFAAYFAREVVMAREKLLNNVRAMDTLHSTASMSVAQIELVQEGLRGSGKAL